MGDILRFLDYFTGSSGLKISYPKKKYVLIKSKQFSKHVFHYMYTRWKLNWENPLLLYLESNSR